MATHHGAIQGGSDHPEAVEHAHPTEQVYIKVAIILSIITGVEVLIYYIESLDAILVPALLIMSAFKFMVVVGYFMHLKFDDKRLTWIFVSGLALAAAVFLVVFATMHWLKISEYVEFIPVG